MISRACGNPAHGRKRHKNIDKQSQTYCRMLSLIAKYADASLTLKSTIKRLHKTTFSNFAAFFKNNIA